MSVLSVQAVARRFADRLLFSEVSFRLAHGDRVGLVGPNGCGKTTLLRIAAGLDEPDSGGVAISRGARIGFLQQELLTEVEGTVEEHARGAAVHLRELEAQLRELEPQLATGDPELLERYADAQHHFEHAGGYDFDATVKRVLGGLGLEDLRDRPARTLSGGERTRLGLARLLLEDPDVLLLDEPTNHLDVNALEWLEKFLIERDDTVLASSHDRWFLDKVTSRTLSFERGTIEEYRGGYSHYARQRAEREAMLTKAASRQAIEIAKTEEFIERFRAGQKSKESRGRAKQLARLERIEAPRSGPRHGWKLEAAHLAGDTALETTPLSVGHGERVVVRTPGLRVGREARIAVVGSNGAGKTTLVRTLVGQLPPIEGYVASAPTARVAFLAQAQAELVGDATVLEALRSASGLGEQEARNLLARFLFRGDDIFREVGVLSGGERSRLALARISAREANLLVLDEPTNHLDLAAREQLEQVLGDYQGTIITVSHDRYFIDKIASEIWLIRDGTLTAFEGHWTDLQRGDARELPSNMGLRAGSTGASLTSGVNETVKRKETGGRGTARKRGTGDPRPAAPPPKRATRRSSPVRKVEGTRALEARISAMELQLSQLEEKLTEIAQQGNYMETRIAGQEHAQLQEAIKALYEEWSKLAEEQPKE